MLKEECSNLEDVRGHPYLLDFEQTFEDDKEVHIISELLEGGELYDAIIELKKHRTYFAEDDSAWMVHNILDGLSYCHDVIGIVHRDLKASNFMFKRKIDVPRGGKHDKANRTRNHRNLRDIKIIDFGMSTKIAPDTGKVQGCMGTSYYVAPEVLTEDSYNSKCDVWSIGVITYLILSRQLPYQGKDEEETVHFLENAEKHQPKYDSMRWMTLDPQAVDFCKSLLQVDPSKRPTAREAMSHPWIVKHCGQPPPQRPRINLEHSIMVDKTAPLPLLSRCSLTFKSSESFDSQRSFFTEDDELTLAPHRSVHMDPIPERQGQEQKHNGSSKNIHKKNLMKLWFSPSKGHQPEEETIHFNSKLEGTSPRTRQSTQKTLIMQD
jgi:serine/threonine protein kinase